MFILIFLNILCLYEKQLRIKYGMTFSSQKVLLIFIVHYSHLQMLQKSNDQNNTLPLEMYFSYLGFEDQFLLIFDTFKWKSNRTLKYGMPSIRDVFFIFRFWGPVPVADIYREAKRESTAVMQ